MLGYTVEEMLGKSALDFVFPEDIPKGMKQLALRKQGIQKQGEFRMRHKNGSELWLHSSATPIFSEHGEYPGSLAMFTDITEKKRLESQLLRAQRMESIGTLAGGIAHDLNNMLTPTMLSLQMLKEKFKDEQSQKLLMLGS